jgi:formylglycine-generating enzyme required for sulfatase activity
MCQQNFIKAFLSVFCASIAIESSNASVAIANPSWWDECPTVNSWRNTHHAYSNQRGIGWVFDGFWPYMWTQTTQSYIYVFTSGSPESFYGYVFAETPYYIWASNAWGWYYRYDTGTWHQFQNTGLHSENAMMLIPGGTFTMGDSFSEGATSERPTHSVYCSAFYIGKYEVSFSEWKTVRDWAISNGYDLQNTGSGKDEDHPVHSISWLSAIKWCNARSEMEGLEPVYYADNTLTTVYRTGTLTPTNDYVDWTANGYRLPTEAEWERAARAGKSGTRFTFGNTISHAQANYYSQAAYSYDLSGINNFHPDWDSGVFPYTCPTITFSASDFGLFNLHGNVAEWCWDLYDRYYYSGLGSGLIDNPKGSTSGTLRSIRGGNWNEDLGYMRNSARYNENPTGTYNTAGLRIVRAAYSN